MFTRVLAMILLIAAVPATAAMGQYWTEAEQEIIDLNQACWDAWASEDLDSVRLVCNEHADARGWWTAESAPAIGWFEKNAKRWDAAFSPRQEWLYWDIRPLSVRVFGDTALIHFWATRVLVDSKDEATTHNQRQLNIWQRIDGRWTWIGGMAVPEDD